MTDQVKQCHGDWEKDRYSFYMGFCTAGISDAAAPAKAMRRMAFTLMNSSLAVGDKLTPFAFEMNVYKIEDAVTLTPKESSRSQFVSEVRRTPMPNSKGGHDIERSLYDILDKIPRAERASTIILLWNKDNASQDPDGHKVSLFSEDNPDLQKAITIGDYRHKLVRPEFQVKSDSKDVSVSITALFPSRLASLEYGKKTPRYPTFLPDTWQPTGDAPLTGETLPNPVKADPVTQTPPLSKTGVDTSKDDVKRDDHRWRIVVPILIIVAAASIAAFAGKRAQAQRKRPPAAASVTPAAPKLETIPGSLRVTIGTDEQTIAPLAKNGNWAITKGVDGKFLWTSQSTPTLQRYPQALPA